MGWTRAWWSSLLLFGCADEGERYEAEIRWTQNGVPHILADDLPSAAFGQGYAFARLSGCILADQIVKVRGERARYLGPGEEDEHLDSDFVHRFLDFQGRGVMAYERLTPDTRGIVDGYVAGYNTFLDERGEELPCADEPWLQPITPQDLMAHYAEIATLASARQMQDYIATAVPPGAERQRNPRTPLSSLREPKVGSNGWAIGAERSQSGRGMLVGNPHFPWEGELKLYESHLRVPGELDVYGASLMGVVGVLIGFNEQVAWTHTVSAGQRFTFYTLDLVPGDPTRYFYGDEERAMEAVEVEIDVLREDGSITAERRTMWRSHYGPVLNVPPLGWSTGLVLTFRDANETNYALIEQFLGMNRADSLEAFQAVHRDVAGIPWVNTIAVSAEGTAWYADTTPTPNLAPDVLQWWLTTDDLVVRLLADSGVVALKGADPKHEWYEQPGARDPGLVPYDAMPKLERRDFVFNANDSHWLSNPREPLEGYSALHGFERTPRSARTRMNATVLLETGEGTASGSDGKFDLPELQAAILNNRGKVAELLRDEVVSRCDATPTVAVEGREVSLVDICQALGGWDLRLDLDSAGALAWREFLGAFEGDVTSDAGPLFAEAFDPANPVDTPRGLAPAASETEDAVLTALAVASERLATAGLAVDATLGDAQYTRKGEQRIPIHGGTRLEGTTNLITYSVFKTTTEPPMNRGELVSPSTGLTDDGYPVNYGTSFLLTVEFAPEGPRGGAFVTYGQSSDPASPWFSDQTERFSAKDWRTLRLSEEDILADPDLAVETVRGAR